MQQENHNARFQNCTVLSNLEINRVSCIIFFGLHTFGEFQFAYCDDGDFNVDILQGTEEYIIVKSFSVNIVSFITISLSH